MPKAIAIINGGPPGPPGPPGDGEVLWSDIAADALASNAEAIAGTDTSRAVTPAGTKAALDARVGDHDDIVAGSPSKFITAALWRDAAPLFNVHDYGAKGDGVTDDTAAIQLAINTCGAAGGGVVWFPHGTYLCNTPQIVATGLTFILTVAYDNVILAGPGHVTSTVDLTGSVARLIAFEGAFKSGSLASWFSRRLTELPVYDLGASITEGAGSITLNTASDAGNFAPGDYIYIRTGQTLSTGTDQPVAEVNQVVSANSTTGVITLAWPTVNPYEQEYYISGTSGLTSTTPTANPAPFGVVKATDHVLVGCGIEGLRISATGITQLLQLWQVVDWRGTDVKLDALRGVMDTGTNRRVRWNNSEMTSRDGGTTAWWVSVGTGCADWDVIDCDQHAASSCYVHIHEGASNINIRGGRIADTGLSAGVNMISVRARARNVHIEGVDVYAYGAAGATGMYVDPSCGPGVLRDNTWHGIGVSINSPDWEIGQHTSRGGASGPGLVVHQVRAKFEHVTLASWVSATVGLTPVIGTLPAWSQIVAITVYVLDGFDSDGTNQITVGYSGSTSAFTASPVDVSTTGVKTVTLQTSGPGRGFIQTARDVIATYTAGGSAPTKGRALVCLTYHRVPRHS